MSVVIPRVEVFVVAKTTKIFYYKTELFKLKMQSGTTICYTKSHGSDVIS